VERVLAGWSFLPQIFHVTRYFNTATACYTWWYRLAHVAVLLHIHEVSGSNASQTLHTSRQIHVQNSTAQLACRLSPSHRAVSLSLPIDTMQTVVVQQSLNNHGTNCSTSPGKQKGLQSGRGRYQRILYHGTGPRRLITATVKVTGKCKVK